MKMTKSKLRSFRMKQVNSETGGELPRASIVRLLSVPSNESPSNENEYWSNVEFSREKNSDFLTYTNKRDEFAYSFFDPPFYAGGQPEDRPKITDIEQIPLGNYYGYKYKGKKIPTSYDDSGFIEITIDSSNQSELPLRFIMIVQNNYGAYDGDLNVASYFYVDVDIDQNVNLSK
jgi:hypothetical protein